MKNGLRLREYYSCGTKRGFEANLEAEVTYKKLGVLVVMDPHIKAFLMRARRMPKSLPQVCKFGGKFLVKIIFQNGFCEMLLYSFDRAPKTT